MNVLYPKLLSNRPWQQSSVAIRKPYIYAEANTAIIGYIENNYGYIAQINMAQPEILQPLIQLDKIIGISVCFDARWSYQSGVYKYYTIGEPYIATIDPNNRLYIQYGIEGTKQQLATSVTAVKLIRGWKHVSVPQDDQGLCAIYLKSGRLYSREYVQQADGSYVWTRESMIQIPLHIIREFEVYRTVDYRLIIVASDGAHAYTCASKRTWPGTSIPYETIAIKETISNSKITLNKVNTFKETDIETIKLSENITGSYTYYEYNVPQNVEAFNEGGHLINLVIANRPMADDLINNLKSLVIVDSTGMPYSIASAEYVYPYVKLTMLNINNAEGNITIKYDAGWSKPNGTAVEAFEVTFTPTGLVPLPPDPPIILSISNVDTEVI